jgi:hypothetical protein
MKQAVGESPQVDGLTNVRCNKLACYAMPCEISARTDALELPK